MGGCIDIFTRGSGDIRFDPDRCRAELRHRYQCDQVPALRLAWPLGPDERQRDETISRLDWAETIVRAQLSTPDAHQRLRDELRKFPAQFLIFFPVSAELSLSPDSQHRRLLRVEGGGRRVTLHDGDQRTTWLLSTREVKVTDGAALADATEVHGRDQIPLSWALPLERARDDVGLFWAFFPTQTRTFIPGILNAPWKLNSDRNALIPGAWNRALMQEAAQLVVDALPDLFVAEDPGKPLDAFPRESRADEIAAPLVDRLWQLLVDAPLIADTHARPCRPRDLYRHPRDNETLAQAWSDLATRSNLPMVHPRCLHGDRSSRLERLAQRVGHSGNRNEAPNLGRLTPAQWFEQVASAEAQRAMQVLELAHAFKNDCKPGEWSPVRPTLRIVPTGSGILALPDEVTLPCEGFDEIHQARIVSCELLKHGGARELLRDVLAVREMTAETVRDQWYEKLKAFMELDCWDGFWDYLRIYPRWQDHFVACYASRIQVQRRDGSWKPPDEVLVPGRLVSDDDAWGNAKLLVHQNHSKDGRLLALLGVSDLPEGVYRVAAPVDDPRLTDWLGAARLHYVQRVPNKARWYLLGPDSLEIPKGFGLLRDLCGVPSARLTRTWMEQLARGGYDDISFGHTTQRSYERITVSHPLCWWLVKYGAWQVGSRVVRLAALIERRHAAPLMEVLNLSGLGGVLEKLAHVVPKVSEPATSAKSFWQTVTEQLEYDPAKAERLQQLYAAALKEGFVPAKVRCRGRDTPLGELYVTTSNASAQALKDSGVAVVWLDEETQRRWVEHGARRVERELRVAWTTQSAHGLLGEVEPALADVLTDDARQRAELRRVCGLKVALGDVASEIPCIVHGNVLIEDEEDFCALAADERLRTIIEHAAGAGWLSCGLPEALDRVANADVARRRKEVSEAPSLAARLLRAVGGKREPLARALGRLEHIHAVQRCTDEELAQLALAQLGPAVLCEVSHALAEQGLRPPERWNSQEAREFVASIGFPADFAHGIKPRRELEEYVTGPIKLPPLHDYQKEVFDGLRKLIVGGNGPGRAIVSLPTGAGKTRVTVEAAVRLVLAGEGRCRYVLWVAQADELCEQAVQAFRQVWVNCGAEGRDLRIVRLWGGNRTPAQRDLDHPLVVVSTIQTLSKRVGREDLQWLSRPPLVVFDECHHAIAPSYSNVLRWFGELPPARGQSLPAARHDHSVIIGLSATPFRTDEDESRRLAARFANTWLPCDQQGLYEWLRGAGAYSAERRVGRPAGDHYLGEV